MPGKFGILWDHPLSKLNCPFIIVIFQKTFYEAIAVQRFQGKIVEIRHESSNSRPK